MNQKKPETEAKKEKPSYIKPLLENIPPILQSFNQWVLWKAIWKESEQKWTKVPIDPKTLRYASSNKRETWSDFDTACKVLAKYYGKKVDGIGFVVTNKDPFVGIDCDRCVDKQAEKNSIAQPFGGYIEQINSYAEYSPSGSGIRIVAKGNLPKGHQCRNGSQIEIYSTGRFLTITGATLDGYNNLREANGELNQFYREVVSNNQTIPKNNPQPDLPEPKPQVDVSPYLSDSRIKKLWGGDISGYPSQSEADLGLCSLLAKHESDPQRVDALFRQSKLYRRKKWNKIHNSAGQTYGEMTIEKAYTGKPKAVPYCEEMAVPEPPAAKPTPESNTSLLFPYDAMTGFMGDFAKTYGEYLKPPEHFFYMANLTIFGLSVCDKLCLYSQRKPAPRFYTIILGESGDTRKSTAIEETDEFFQEFFEKGTIAVCRGAASAEGIGKIFNSTNKVLLYYDEFKVFVEKSNIKNSTLLPAVNTLFESKRYENRTAKDPIVIENALLSLLAASTVDTFSNMFKPKFLHIGFNNRLFLVPGDSDKCISLPPLIPKEKKEYLYHRLRQRLQLIDSNPEISLTKEATEKWDEFYKKWKSSKSIFKKRIDTYGLRLMPLLAINDMKTCVDLETIEKAISILDWQHNVRRIYDPIDVESRVGKMEEKIRRQLIKKSPLKKRDLQRAVNYNRGDSDIWVFDQAAVNLAKNGELEFDATNGICAALDIEGK
jgi:putative DNA primase/helicase